MDGLALHAGTVLEKSFQPGEEAHAYHLDLAPGQYATVDVEQRGVDVEVVLTDPEGGELLNVDSLNGSWGSEALAWEGGAGRGGRYRLTVRRLDGRGSYRMAVQSPGQTSERHRARARAVALISRARLGTSLQPALADAREAYRLWRKAGDVEQAVLALLQIADLQAREAPGSEVATCRQALGLLPRSNAARLRLSVLHRLGRACRLAGDLRCARDRQSEALALARKLGDGQLAAVSLQNLAVIKDEEHDPRGALQLYRQARAALSPREHPAQAATVLHNMAATQSLLGRWDEALDSFTEALRLRRGLGKPREVAATLTEIGWLHYLQGQPGQAIAAYEEALALRAVDPPTEAGILDRLGSAHRALGRWGEARAAYSRALAICRDRSDRRNEANTRLNLAELELARGAPAPAREQLGQARALFAQARGNDPHAEIHTLHLEARTQAAEGDLEAARQTSTEVLRRLDEVRRGLASQALSLPFFATRRVYLDHHLDVLMALHRGDPQRGWDREALVAAEQGRARGFLETLLASSAADPDDEAAARRRSGELRARLNALELARMEADDDPPEAGQALDREIRDTVEELADLEAGQARAEDRAAAPPLLDAAGIRALLDDGTLLLYYHLGKEQSYLWAVGPDAVASYTLPPAAAIAAVARDFTRRLPTADFGNRRDQARFAARRLGMTLLGPAQGLLGGRRLVFVADGALAQVPLNGLIEPGSGQPLAFRHEIVQVPSASVLALLRRRAAARRQTTEGQLAVLADPVYSALDSRVRAHGGGVAPPATGEREEEDRRALTRSARDLGLDGFLRLDSSRREGERITALVPPSQRLLALDFAASRATVTRGSLRGFRILHFATHALLHPEHPELSGLVLSLVDEQGRPQDGFLRAHEIATLDLPADLVVLSACQTALGREVLGEGLLSLPRSLMQAGATRVVVSRWAVEDSATAVFMDRFYRAMLVQGLPPAAALRAAQLSMARDPRWSSPYYWAGFELQGDWR